MRPQRFWWFWKCSESGITAGTKNMRRFFAIPIISLLFVVLVPVIASAHVLQVDGDMGAVLHINPDDNPTAKVPINFELSFQDGKGIFSLANCACNIAFVQNGSTIASMPLAATGTTFSSDTFTFPKADVYVFHVTGKPKQGTGFKPFALDYTVRVGSGQADMQQMPLLLWVGLGMVIGLILLLAYASDYDGGSKQPKGDL